VHAYDRFAFSRLEPSRTRRLYSVSLDYSGIYTMFQ